MHGRLVLGSLRIEISPCIPQGQHHLQTAVVAKGRQHRRESGIVPLLNVKSLLCQEGHHILTVTVTGGNAEDGGIVVILGIDIRSRIQQHL